MKDEKNNTGVENTGDYNTGNYNTGDRNTGYRNTGNYNTGYCNTGYRNTGDCNTGNYNTGDCNTGYCNTGWFNTDEPKARFFNQETDMALTEFYDSDKMPSQVGFPLNRWVYESEMTKEEKKEIEGWKTMGGYLKTLDYKEAWKIFWEETDEENKQKFLDLPNFSSEIFKSITGIEVEKENSKKQELIKKAKELTEKADEMLKTAEKM
jgi:hypothetical protein